MAVLLALSFVALGCQAQFDIERDIAAAGNEDLLAETASDVSNDAGDGAVDQESGSDETDSIAIDPDDAEEAEDADGSFSFGFSTGSGGGDASFIPTGPGSDPDRDLSWNTDPDSVLAHLESIGEGRISFEWKTVPISDDHSVTGPFPIGWEITDPFLGITLDPGDDFDFFTDAEIDAGCQGSCSPQDWGALMDDPELSPFARMAQAATVVLQDLAPIAGESPGGRLLVSLDPDSSFTPAEITVTRWSDDATHFLWCKASLDEEDVSLWPVMADMCAAMRPAWMD